MSEVITVQWFARIRKPRMVSTLTNTYKLEQIYEGSVALLFSFIFERKNRSTMEVFTPCVLGWAGWGRGGWLAFYHNFLGSFSELSGLPIPWTKRSGVYSLPDSNNH